MGSDSRAAERLPSLPQVLVRILDAVHGERAGLAQIADILRHDPAMAARLIGVANSSFYSRASRCRNVERALLVLGTDTVKTIVITDAIRQFFGRFQPRHQPFLKAFWRRSLMGANFAHILANLTGYQAADEAYLCGLLTDVGQLVLYNRHGQRYLDLWSAADDDRALLAAEHEQLGTTHAEVGAALVEAWQSGGFMADALRYHHEPGAQILDANHLVKIINLASSLSAPGPVGDEATLQADQLFGLNEALTRELRERIGTDIERLAASLDIDIGAGGDDSDMQRARDLLGERLGELGQLGQASAGLWRSQSQAVLESTVQRTVYMMLEVERCVLFSLDPGRNLLTAHLGGGQGSDGQAPAPDFSLPLLPGRSAVSDALLDGEPHYTDATANAQPPVVIDRQLLNHCRAVRLLCLPLRSAEEAVGVLVLGLAPETEDPLQARPALLGALCSEIAGSLGAQQRAAADADSDAFHLQQQIREVLHEAGNPLSIIRNYLETLRVKLGSDHQAHGDLALIKNEIDRVGAILLRLREPQAPGADSRVDINALVRDIARIFQQSLCATHGIELQLRLADDLDEVGGHAAKLQQVLTNLLKNAVEALPAGGRIVVGTENAVVVNGHRFAVITVQDNGPGIPEAVLGRLFSPVVSDKGGGHAGLGLSISKKLVDEMGGSIWCRSGRNGTQFQVLLPQ